MLIVRESAQHPLHHDDLATLAPVVAVIGFFDGVHRGHQYLLQQVKAEAQKRGGAGVVITFDRHPRRVVKSDYQPPLLTTLPEKLAALDATGVDACIVLEFTPEVAKHTSRDFMEHYLRDALGIQCLVVGYDHHFGSDIQNGYEAYLEYGQELGIDVVRADAFDDENVQISSSLVRRMLNAGNVQMANSCLGRPYTLTGTIVHGRHCGHTLGFPTANLEPDDADKVIPASGVYAVRAILEGKTYSAMLNIGWRPTLCNGNNMTIEAHIFDFDEDVYGRQMTLVFEKRLRDEIKFNSLEALKAQLHQDVANAKKYLF